MWVTSVPWVGAALAAVGLGFALAAGVPSVAYVAALIVVAGLAVAGFVGWLSPPWWFAIPALLGLACAAPVLLLLHPLRPEWWATLRDGVNGKWRRYVLVTWYPEYVREWAQRRLGDCNRCGACCKFVFQCPHYEELPGGTGKCRVFAAGSRLRPEQCARFPIDPLDLRGVADVCSYSFAPLPQRPAAGNHPAVRVDSPADVARHVV